MGAVRAPALMVALLVAGCTAAQPERNERTAAEDQVTTEGTAAPGRNEQGAEERATTTEGTAAPGRNERGAIGVAEFLAGQRSGLARYQDVREDLVRLTGRLRDVSNLGADPDNVWDHGRQRRRPRGERAGERGDEEPGAGDRCGARAGRTQRPDHARGPGQEHARESRHLAHARDPTDQQPRRSGRGRGRGAPRPALTGATGPFLREDARRRRRAAPRVCSGRGEAPRQGRGCSDSRAGAGHPTRPPQARARTADRLRSLAGTMGPCLPRVPRSRPAPRVPIPAPVETPPPEVANARIKGPAPVIVPLVEPPDHTALAIPETPDPTGAGRCNPSRPTPPRRTGTRRLALGPASSRPLPVRPSGGGQWPPSRLEREIAGEVMPSRHIPAALAPRIRRILVGPGRRGGAW